MCYFRFLFVMALALNAMNVASANSPGGQEKVTVQKFQSSTALEASQQAIGNLVDAFPLTDDRSMAVSMADFRGKPLVLSLVYTSCYHTCPVTIRHLAKVVDKAREALGDDSFNVAVLGFDTQNDNAMAMRQFAKKQGIDDGSWHLLSADADTIAALTKQLGFLYFPSPRGFDHMVQATVIDAEGRIYRQVYGEVFDTPLLIEPLKDLVLNRAKQDQTLVSNLVDKVRFFCTTYDPARDAYHFDYSLFIGMMIGGLIILFTTGFIVNELIQTRRRRRQV